MKIITIVGARPQFIKAATISREIADLPDVDELIIHTGQHFDHNMSEVFFEQMNIPKPHVNLNIHGGSHAAMTGEMIKNIEPLIESENPDILLVYGDTNSTLAGAIVASKLDVRLAHVEAGLRSYNMSMPEEVNRVLTDRISNFLYCPTQKSMDNLKKEGFPQAYQEIVLSGDVMYDATKYYAEQAERNSSLDLQSYVGNDDFYLCTVHRQENTDNIHRLSRIIEGLNQLSENSAIICPLHPRTRQIIEDQKLKIKFQIINPVSYFDMLMLLNKCEGVITDSGGLQKEAYFSERACFTLRNETEWVELVENGYNTLINVENENWWEQVVNNSIGFSSDDLLYGEGHASRIIVEHMKGRID